MANWLVDDGHYFLHPLSPNSCWPMCSCRKICLSQPVTVSIPFLVQSSHKKLCWNRPAIFHTVFHWKPIPVSSFFSLPWSATINIDSSSTIFGWSAHHLVLTLDPPPNWQAKPNREVESLILMSSWVLIVWLIWRKHCGHCFMLIMLKQLKIGFWSWMWPYRGRSSSFETCDTCSCWCKEHS